MQFEVVCAWCGTVTGLSSVAHSHGICDQCYEFMLGVPNLSAEQLDALPFGVIFLNRDGTVLAYNAVEQRLAEREAAGVIGRNFFSDIAPCTQVKDFQGRYEDFLQSDLPDETFEFVFAFPHGKTKVQIVFFKSDSSHAYIFVKKSEVQTSDFVKKSEVQTSDSA